MNNGASTAKILKWLEGGTGLYVAESYPATAPSHFSVPSLIPHSSKEFLALPRWADPAPRCWGLLFGPMASSQAARCGCSSKCVPTTAGALLRCGGCRFSCPTWPWRSGFMLDATRANLPDHHDVFWDFDCMGHMFVFHS